MAKTNKKYIYIGLGVAVVAVLLIGGKQGWFGNKSKFIEVESQVIAQSDIIETVAATGKIQPEIEVKISSEVSGEIIELPVVEGQVVKKGDLLVRINPDLYTSSLNRSVSNLSSSRASLSQTDAQFAEATATYNRNKTLFDKGIIARAEWDKAVATFEVAKASRNAAYHQVQSAQATVSEAQDNLRRTTIYAPADGTISALNVELGERVLGTQQMTGTEILRVANLNNMEVEVDVNENDIVKISVGDTAKVEVDAYLKKEFSGIVTSISNSANATTSADQVTNFKVKVRILKESYADLLEGKPAAYSPFRPGMTATVDIITRRRNKVLAVPISSVLMKSDTTSVKSYKVEDPNKPAAPAKNMEVVFVKEGEKAKIRVVETGIQDGTNIEIISGLKPGDEVITGPYNTVTKELTNGAAVGTTKKE